MDRLLRARVGEPYVDLPNESRGSPEVLSSSGETSNEEAAPPLRLQLDRRNRQVQTQGSSDLSGQQTFRKVLPPRLLPLLLLPLLPLLLLGLPLLTAPFLLRKLLLLGF